MKLNFLVFLSFLQFSDSESKTYLPQRTIKFNGAKEAFNSSSIRSKKIIKNLKKLDTIGGFFSAFRIGSH